eukprot:m.4017 g.4017  ORF g.4017 m.4017 type:complete len:51 (-) comp3124_c0_seq1:32-184(-)
MVSVDGFGFVLIRLLLAFYYTFDFPFCPAGVHLILLATSARFLSIFVFFF